MIHYGIRIVFDPPPAKYGRKLPEVTRVAYREMALEWHHVFLPLHFLPGAASRYGYQKRTLKYIRRKFRTGHGNRDLVYSGETMRNVNMTPRIRAYPTRTRLDMYAAPYVRQRPYLRKAPNLYKEITTIVPVETTHLGRKLRDVATAELRRVKGSYTVSIQSSKTGSL